MVGGLFACVCEDLEQQKAIIRAARDQKVDSEQNDKTRVFGAIMLVTLPPPYVI